jgi:hypothetical protein
MDDQDPIGAETSSEQPDGGDRRVPRRSPASTYATGGGGVTLERRIGALYLAALLTANSGAPVGLAPGPAADPVHLRDYCFASTVRGAGCDPRASCATGWACRRAQIRTLAIAQFRASPIAASRARPAGSRNARLHRQPRRA